MKEKQLQGEGFIILARCSTPGQVDGSIEEQARLCEAHGRELGMTCVGQVILGGMTGSVPGLRHDIDGIVRRKQDRNDFGVVVVQDSSRLTRSGPAHGLSILFTLRSVGIRVISVKDDLPEGDIGDVMRTMQYYAAKEQASGIAFASTAWNPAPAHLRRPAGEGCAGGAYQVLTNCRRVHELVEALSRRELRAEPDQSLKELRREKTAIEEKLSFVLDEMDQLGQEAVRAKVRQFQARLQVVVDQIRRRTGPRVELADPGRLADSVCQRLRSLADELPKLAPTAVRSLPNSFISRLVVDLESREVELEVSLPDWASLPSGRLCLDANLADKTTRQTQPESGHVLARLRMVWTRRGGYVVHKLAA